MDSTETKSPGRKWAAFVFPMAIFAVLTGLNHLLPRSNASFWSRSPEYWIYPAQTIGCGLALLWFWRDYPFRPLRQLLFTTAVALVVFGIWIAPQQILGFAPRRDGFSLAIFANQPLIYWGMLAVRFLRLVIVVPLVEEIFFRGFLLRYLIRDDFESIPIGTFSWFSFVVAAAGFGLVHSPADWTAGLVAGTLYNVVVYRTRNLASCVLAHALTNLFLGLWIMKTEQWGFW